MTAVLAQMVSSHATTAKCAWMLASSAPPRRTVRAVFPHTALRQSSATRQHGELTDMFTLQIQQPVTLQSRVQGLASPKRLASPLAPIPQKHAKPTSYEMVYSTKHFPGIPIAKVAGPPTKDGVDFLYGLPQRLLIPAQGLSPNLVPQAPYRFLGRMDIQILLAPPLQIPIIPQG